MTTMPLERRMSSASGVVGPLAASATILALMRAAFARGDRALEGRGHQDVDGQLEQLRVGDLLAVGRGDGALLLLGRVDELRAQALLVVDAAARVRDREHLHARLFEEPRDVHARVAVTLDGRGRALQGQVHPLGGLVDRDEAALGGRLVAAGRAAERNRLARDDAERRVALRHRERVHDPGHVLGRRVDVGRRDVAVVAEDDGDLGRVAPGQPLVLVHRERLRVDRDAALGAAEGDVDDGALPGHPHRQRLDLVERHARVEPDAALGGPARDRVLHAVAREDLDLLVVQLDRDRDDQLPLRRAQQLARAGVELEELGGAVELA